jgi:hypothetical protein
MYTGIESLIPRQRVIFEQFNTTRHVQLDSNTTFGNVDTLEDMIATPLTNSHRTIAMARCPLSIKQQNLSLLSKEGYVWGHCSRVVEGGKRTGVD